MIWNGASLAILAIALWLSSDYLYWFLRGPLAASDAQLLAMIERGGNRSLIGYVESTRRKLEPTKWQEVTTLENQPGQKVEKVHSEQRYFLLPVEDKRIMVLAKEAPTDSKLTGPLSPAREIDRTVWSGIEKDDPRLAGKILPIVLHADAAFNVFGYILLPTLAIWGGIACWNLASALLRRVHFDLHPLMRQFASYKSEAAPQDQATNQVDREVASGSAKRFGKVIVTDSWVLRPTMFGVQAVPLSSLVWAFLFSKGAENYVMMMTRDKRTTPLGLRSEDATGLLRALAQSQPQALYGYDKERHAQWLKDPQSVIDQLTCAAVGK